MTTDLLVELVYIIASILFIFGLKLLNSPKTAIKGNYLSAVGMLLAVIITILNKQIISYQWIIVGLLSGSIVGIYLAKENNNGAKYNTSYVFRKTTRFC